MFQEVIEHLIVTKNPVTGIETSRTDKVMMGGIYREASNNEHSFNGEAVWTDPHTGIHHRLVALTSPARL